MSPYGGWDPATFGILVLKIRAAFAFGLLIPAFFGVDRLTGAGAGVAS